MSERKNGRGRRRYNDEMKAEAVQLLLDRHSAQSVESRLGLSGPIFYIGEMRINWRPAA